MWSEEYRPEEVRFPGHSLVQYSLQQLSNVVSENHSLVFWIGIYTAMSLVACVLGTARYCKFFLLFPFDARDQRRLTDRTIGYVFWKSLQASRVLFEDMLRVVVRAPLRWLDTVPTGRILNRFSKDFETIDSQLANNIAFLFWNVLHVVGINLAAYANSPSCAGTKLTVAARTFRHI